MLKQSLEVQCDADAKDMNKVQSAKTANEVSRSAAKGDRAVATKDLEDAENKLATANASCMTAAKMRARKLLHQRGR